VWGDKGQDAIMINKTLGRIQMLKQFTNFLFASLLLVSVGALSAFAQDKTDFKAGDAIYVNAFSGGCVKATVTQTDPKYSVHILEGLYKDRDTFYNESRIRECPQTAPPDKPKADIQTPAEAANPPTPNSGDLKVGTRVDVYLTGNQQGKNRGTIIETKGSQYRVLYDGCAEKDAVWESSS